MNKPVNASKGARIALSLLLLAAPAPPAMALDTDLPDLGNSAGSLMSPKRERDLGKAFMRGVRRSEKVMDDPLLADYIEHLGQKLVAASDVKGTPFHFFLIDDPTINAFAGPGGHIGVFSGLVMTTDTESELAAVLAHEIAHVTQQHLMRAWESTSQLSIPSAAVLLAAIVLGATVGGDAAAAAAVGGQAALIQQQINFTRANEQEADRVGIDILAHSGFEPRAMPSFFDRMGKANRIYASKLPEFLMTHPVTTSRTADALGRAEQFAYRQAPEDLRYQLARINLVQRQMDRPEEAVRELGLMLEDGRFRNEAALRYGIALAQIRAGQFDDAAKTLDRLLEQYPEVVEFVVSRAQIDAQQGATERALKRLERSLTADPGSLALNLTYAETALAAGKPADAETRLQRFLDFRGEEPRIYQLLSRAAGDQDKRALGHEYLAEYYYLTGDVKAAILQLEIALKVPGLNFYDASRLESRLVDLRAEDEEKDDKGRPKP
ncbi:MAG: M48 family metallopeptidase [Gammaproteobacteria bacterium]|nr:M48 family metallopeptidase [Gammaproteobacteria bacterium]